MHLELAGETLIALPERALYWPRERTLFVADVHLGKAESFRAMSVPIPSGSTDATLGRLSAAIGTTRAERLIILGDLWHAKAGRTERIDSAFLAWRASHVDLDVVLVEGNHDRRSGRVPDGANVREVAEPHSLGPFALRHYPEPAETGYVLSGHLHPAVRMEGKGGQVLRLPCYWFGERVGVLPSFGDFTGSATICPKPEDRVLIVAEGKVLRVR